MSKGKNSPSDVREEDTWGQDKVRLAKAKKKNGWKSVKPPMLLKVEVPVWFSSCHHGNAASKKK